MNIFTFSGKNVEAQSCTLIALLAFQVVQTCICAPTCALAGKRKFILKGSPFISDKQRPLSTLPCV